MANKKSDLYSCQWASDYRGVDGHQEFASFLTGSQVDLASAHDATLTPAGLADNRKGSA